MFEGDIAVGVASGSDAVAVGERLLDELAVGGVVDRDESGVSGISQYPQRVLACLQLALTACTGLL